MAEEYKQGMVSQILGGGQEASGGALASLFVAANQHVGLVAESTAERKRTPDPPSEQGAHSLPPEKKVKVETEEVECPSSSKKDKAQAQEKGRRRSGHKAEKKKSSLAFPSTSSAGFRPPPGVVHEALAQSSGMKRKSFSSDDEDNSEDEHVRKGIKEDKRPRRDRLKRASERRTVFVGNVPLTVNKKTLGRLFKQFGEMESLRFRCAPVADPATKKKVAVITKEFHDKRHNISAYICFKEKEAAKKALALNGYLIDGFHLRVDSARPTLKSLSKRSVFVGNIPFAIEEESIRQHFADCGEIENVRVVRDRKTNLGKGFCYILFKSADSVSLALQLKNSELEKRKLRVERCVDSSKKGREEEKKTKKLGATNRRLVSTGPKAKHKQASRNQRAANKPPADGDQKVKQRKVMWQPTNASASQALQSQKTALKKKQRKGQKKRKQRSKANEVSRVLGPAPQVPVGGGPKKAKPKNRKDGKGGKKGKRGL